MTLGWASLIVGQVSLEVLYHPERLDPLLAEDRLHLLVRSEELSVLWILEIVFLQIGPQGLHDLSSAHFLSLLSVSYTHLTLPPNREV